MQAEQTVLYEWYCEAVCRSMESRALRTARWLGLSDDGWSRVHRELDRRREL
jgi:hypothetical protein